MELGWGTLAMLVALTASGCAKSGDAAIVRAANPSQKRIAQCNQGSPTHELDATRSTIDVAGSDRITGEHVGRIHTMSGTATLADDGTPTSVTIEADLASLTMDSSAVENFVKSSSFLDVARYPTAKFRSCEIKKSGNELTVRGILDLHGVTREVEHQATLTKDKDGQVFRANFRLPRHDFKIERSDMLDSFISPDIRIQLVLRAKRLPGDQPAAKRSVAETSSLRIPGSNAE